MMVLCDVVIVSGFYEMIVVIGGGEFVLVVFYVRVGFCYVGWMECVGEKFGCLFDIVYM